MKEMRLWDVGFKELASHAQYAEKFHVAADSADEAETRARECLAEGINQGDWISDALWDSRYGPAFKKYKDTPDEEMPSEEALLAEFGDEVREAQRKRAYSLLLSKMLDVGTVIVP